MVGFELKHYAALRSCSIFKMSVNLRSNQNEKSMNDSDVEKNYPLSFHVGPAIKCVSVDTIQSNNYYSCCKCPKKVSVITLSIFLHMLV